MAELHHPRVPLTERVCVIHQPTFLPWLGLMQKVSRADVFVILDEVQFARRDVQNRVRIKTPAGAPWLTVPVVQHGRYEQRIRDVVISDHYKPDDLLKTIRHAYARTVHFDELFPGLEAIVSETGPGDLLIDLNTALLAWLFDQFGFTPECVFQSELDVTGARAELLLSICKAVDATVYVAGAKAAAEYMDNAYWLKRGIRVDVARMPGTAYPQLWDGFVFGLSSIDLLFNLGADLAAMWLDALDPPEQTDVQLGIEADDGPLTLTEFIDVGAHVCLAGGTRRGASIDCDECKARL